MLYCLKDELSRNKFIARFNHLLEHAELVELTDATRRSSAQNNYLHAVLGAVALHIGESLDYIKQEVYKKRVNPHIFLREHDNPILGHVIFLRSSAELNKEEMSESIDRFRKWASELGIYTPSPEDLLSISQITAQMSQTHYL